MKQFLLTAALLCCACTGTRFEYSDADDGSKEMISYKTYLLFYDDEEKLRLNISSDNGGQIAGMFWEGTEVLSADENYPDEKSSFKKLRASIIDDGEGLIVVTNTNRGIYQLRRSYNIKFDEEREQHIIEVIYNVKNHSSENEINQQWQQVLHLTETPKAVRKLEKLTLDELKKIEGLMLNRYAFKGFVADLSKNSQMEIELEGVAHYSAEIDGNKITVGNEQPLILGPKERLSWKVHYKFRNK